MAYEMVDRVAKAMCRKLYDGNVEWDSLPENNSPAMDPDIVTREDFRAMARAGIAEQREPTEAMKQATVNVLVGHSWGKGGEYIYEGADDIWRAMIDEALSN